ncbi:hypothetical protein OSJ20_19330, partial [Mycobacterium ulcerans]
KIINPAHKPANQQRRSPARSSVFAAIKRLHDTGVLRPLTNRKRDQVWGASLLLDELDDLGHRISRASAPSVRK